MFLLIYLLLAGLLIAVSIANGVLTILKVHIPGFPQNSTPCPIAGRAWGGTLPHDPHFAGLHLLLDCRLLSQVAHTKIYPENVSLYVQAADEEVNAIVLSV